MRGLYREFYQRRKGFSTEDMIGIINRLTKRDYHDFYRRYVWRVEVPDYDAILGYAGYRLKTGNLKRTVLGFDPRPGASGETLSVASVDPGSTAAGAGLAVGDLILKVDNTNALRFGWFEDGKAGQTVKLTIKRAGEEKELTMTIGSRDEVAYDLVEMAQPTPDQLKIREGWLALSK